MRIAALAVCCLALASTARADSVTLQGDSARTGNVEVPGFAPPLDVAWTAKLRGTVSAPVVVGATAYVTQPSAPEDDLHTTGPNVELLALDADTGAERWKRTIAARLGQGNLSVIGGHLIVTDDFGQVSAFGLDGTLAWTFKISANSALVAADLGGDVVVPDGAGTSPLIAIDQNGKERWRSNVYGDAPPAVAAGRVFEGLECGAAYALEGTGASAWTNPGTCSGPGTASSVSDGRVWTADRDGDGAVLDAATGTRLRAFDGAGAPSFGAGLAVFWRGDSRSPQSVGAVDAATGKPAWDWTPPEQVEFAARSGPFIVGDTVFVGVQNHLWARDLRTGAARQGLTVAGTDDPRTHAYGGTPGIAAGHGLLLVPTRDALTALRPRKAPPGVADTPAAPATTPSPAPAASPSSRLLIHAPERIRRHRLRDRGVRIRLTLPASVDAATVRLVRRGRTVARTTAGTSAVRLRASGRLRGHRLMIVASAAEAGRVRQVLRLLR